MNERWERVGALFDRALAEPAGNRVDAVRASGEPADIQDEVIALIKSHEGDRSFLEPPALLEAGAQIGPYRVERVLGRGGMGVVYLAHDTRLHRAVAMKALSPHLFQDDRMRSRLRQEARAAAALSHPAIATVFALEEAGDQLFIISEYLEGHTLREEIDGGPLPAARALATAREIALGLQAAHDRGVVHRDLKPENIVRTRSGAIKILDFGLAQFDSGAQDLKSATRLTDTGMMPGTPPYMAPEQLLGQTTSARTDQFAFGVVMYELFTAKHPFGGGPLPSMVARVLSVAPDPSWEIPDRVWPIIERALQKSPENRFATTADLLNALADATSGVGIPDPSQLPTRAPSRQEITSRQETTSRQDSPPDTSFAGNWWQTHQVIVALAYWLMVWPAWQVHKWTGAYGVLVFLATLAAVVVGGNLRFHLWFTARALPRELAAQRANVSQWLRAADIAFSLIVVATGLVLAGEHTGWSALFVSVGLGAALAFLVIEPATARAAFSSQEP